MFNSKQSSYYKGDRKEVSSLIDKRYKRILEIGCGDGEFASNFTECEYYGVEPNFTAWEKSKKYPNKVLFWNF